MPQPVTEDPFRPEVAAAVSKHMNTDHADDCLLIVRALGALPEASAAEMVGLSPAGVRFRAQVGDTSADVEVPWRESVETRAQIRGDVVRMYHEACAVLGVDVRPSEEH